MNFILRQNVIPKIQLDKRKLNFLIQHYLRKLEKRKNYEVS